ncbi:hypothetical protein GGI42DRAFT_1785 [Trichoderma sp. SZMC 28013]
MTQIGRRLLLPGKRAFWSLLLYMDTWSRLFEWMSGAYFFFLAKYRVHRRPNIDAVIEGLPAAMNQIPILAILPTALGRSISTSATL